MGGFLQNTFLPVLMKFVNTRGVRAIKDGMMYTMPLIIVGAAYLLFTSFPITPIQDAINAAGITPFLSHGYTSTFNVIAIVTAIGVGYTWAKNEGFEPLSAGIISMAVFLIFIPDQVPLPNLFQPDGTTLIYGTVKDITTNEITQQITDSLYPAVATDGSVGDAITSIAGLDKTWLAGQGMIGAIIAGLVTGWVYSMFLKKDIRIKLPAAVPDGVSAAFTGLIPAAVLCSGALLLYGCCMAITHSTPIEIIYKFVQTPLQGAGGSLPGVIIFETLIPVFWFFGVHGAAVVNSVAQPIALANQSHNAQIFDALKAQGLSDADAVAKIGANGGHIFTEAFQNMFQAPTGSGITIGLVVFMVFFAKSMQMKQVGKLGLGCGIFNINEPVLFGTPIVLNPKLLVPFIVSPLFCNIGAYVLTKIGFIPYTRGVTIPWTTPPILSGLIAVGWQAAAWQAVALVASFFVYLPFAKSVDNDYLAAEQEDAA